MMSGSGRVFDTAVEFIQATVQLEQPTASGQRTVGTGFLISSVDASGAPRTVLVTAHHVLDGMTAPIAAIGYRTAAHDGGWTYSPAPLRIRDDAGEPLWTRHPAQDVAALVVEAPPEFAKAAIPAGYLAAEGALERQGFGPGDELIVLGFPRGLAANNAGFPILRSGRIASYPLTSKASPTFLLDFSVFPGNSGGPVFAPGGTGTARIKASGAPRPVVAGLLTQQVEFNSERLEIGVVTHARYIVETLRLMQHGIAPAVEAPAPEVAGATPVVETPERRSPVGRAIEALGRLFDRAVFALRDAGAGLIARLSGGAPAQA